jgi:hypothetical protein
VIDHPLPRPMHDGGLVKAGSFYLLDALTVTVFLISLRNEDCQARGVIGEAAIEQEAADLANDGGSVIDHPLPRPMQRTVFFGTKGMRGWCAIVQIASASF